MAIRANWVVRCGIAAAIVEMLSGCLPAVQEKQVRVIRADGKPTNRQEQKNAILSSATLEQESVKVFVQNRQECRSVTETPMAEDSGIERTLSRGTLAQATNLTLSGLLLAAGISGYNNAANRSCNKTVSVPPTPTNPNPVDVERSCTPEEKNQQTSELRNWSIFIASSSIIPLGAFVWNLGRAKDSIKTMPVLPRVESSNWDSCGAPTPAIGVPVEVVIGGIKKQAKTNAKGEVFFSLSDFSSEKEPNEALVVVLPDQDRIISSVKLLETKIYADWDRRQKEQDSKRKAEVEEMDTRFDAARKARESNENSLKESKKNTVKSLENFVKANFSTTFKHKTELLDICFNRVDTEVPCNSAAAFTKTTEAAVKAEASFANRSKFNVRCKLFTRSGESGSNVEIGKGKSHTFKIEVTHIKDTLKMSKAEKQHIFCEAPVTEMRKAANVSVESLEELGDIKKLWGFLFDRDDDVTTIVFVAGDSFYYLDGNDLRGGTKN